MVSISSFETSMSQPRVIISPPKLPLIPMNCEDSPSLPNTPNKFNDVHFASDAPPLPPRLPRLPPARKTQSLHGSCKEPRQNRKSFFRNMSFHGFRSQHHEDLSKSDSSDEEPNFQRRPRASLPTEQLLTGPHAVMVKILSSLLNLGESLTASRRSKRRVVLKNGDCNVSQGNVAKRKQRYLQDIFTTLVDIKWRWALLMFLLSFILSWFIFSLVWLLIAYLHGDTDIQNWPENQVDAEYPWKPCANNVYDFTSCLLFSIETQHTIGYGFRYITEECPQAIFVLCVQSVTGMFVQALMVGIVFAKLSRPKKRTQTLLFSKNAVICQRDGQLCLTFRVGDMRKSHIIEAHVRAQLIQRRLTREGEIIPYYQHELKLGTDGEDDRIFLVWPTTIVHSINSDSPFYGTSAADLLKQKFELVVILEGVIESTGMSTQARKSYLPNEVLWGHRFVNIISFTKSTEQFFVDYSLFHDTVEVTTPLCSQKDIDSLSNKEDDDDEDNPRMARLLPEFRLQIPPDNFSESSGSAMSSPSTARTDEFDNHLPSSIVVIANHNNQTRF